MKRERLEAFAAPFRGCSWLLEAAIVAAASSCTPYWSEEREDSVRRTLHVGQVRCDCVAYGPTTSSWPTTVCLAVDRV